MAEALTEEHHSWLSRFCGIDTRSSTQAKAGGPDADEPGFFDKAKAALAVAGEVTGVSGAVRTVEAKASAAVDVAKKVGSIVSEHPADAVEGLAYGAVQGLAPLGFVAPSPKPKSQAFELARGVGMTAGGLGAMGMGGGEEVVGIAADATGGGAVVGVPLNIVGAVTIASGATATAAGVVTIGNALSMGSPGSSDEPTYDHDDQGVTWAEPQTLAEEIAMQDAKAGGGEVIMEGPFGDPEFQEPGWVKKGITIKKTADGNKIEIHYMYNAGKGEATQFKFLSRGTYKKP